MASGETNSLRAGREHERLEGAPRLPAGVDARLKSSSGRREPLSLHSGGSTVATAPEGSPGLVQGILHRVRGLLLEAGI